MVSVRRSVEVEDQMKAFDVRDLIVPGLGNRRIFRILMANACRHACDDCPMRAERDAPGHVLEPARLARLFMTAFRRGWCDGLFVTSGIPKDPVRAMDRMLELVELLRVTYGYRGYLHVKALAGAEPGQIEKLVRLVDRVSYNLEARCQQALDEHAPGKERGEVREIPPAARDTAAAVREARRSSARKAPPPLLPAALRAPRGFTAGATTLRERRLYEADQLIRRYGFRADELPYGDDGHLPLDQDPKLAWASRHPERFPVEISTASRDELQRVPGFGPRAVERIIAIRASGALKDLSDLRRLGVRVGRAGGFVTLRGRILGTRIVQPALFQPTPSSSAAYAANVRALR